MKSVRVDFGGEFKEFPLGTSLLLYGPVGSGKKAFMFTLVREMLRNYLPCVWVCVDEGPVAVREKMTYLNIDYSTAQEGNQLRFIDLYSEQITGRPLSDPYVVGCSSAFNLNEINRALMRALSELNGQGLVVFDSISTLLLYNKASSVAEFLKVHMSRITSAGFTGFFIMQRDLHDPQTDETMKMMCDAVLEFGFDGDRRKIGVLKLPLGSSGDWIESSLFAWQQPQAITVSKPPAPKKYLDSGGYLEELRDSVTEGLKAGFAEAAKAEKPAQQVIIGFQGMPDNLKEELKALLAEQSKLSEAAQDVDARERNGRQALDQLASRESQAATAMREIDEQNASLRRAVDAKKSDLAELEAQKRIEDGKLMEAERKIREVKSKVDSILGRKKALESRLQDIMAGVPLLSLDMSSILKDAVGKSEANVAKCRQASEAVDVKVAALRAQIKSMIEESAVVGRRSFEKRVELDQVRTRKASVESEIGLVSAARSETESRLVEITAKRKLLEDKLKELGGERP